jgi:hypothetical protein
MATEHITPTAHASLVGGSTASRRKKRPVRELTPEDVRRFLHYDPKTGRFWWKIRSYDTFEGDAFTRYRCGKSWNQKCAGRRALTADSEGRGYLVGSVNSACVYAHRVAWIHYYGEKPPEGMYIDHINGDKSDNRIENLRLVTPQQSQFNTPKRGGISGLKGAAFDHTRGKWVANMKQGPTMKFLGYFDTAEEAAARYQQEAERFQGEYAYHNSAGKTR